MVGLATKPEKFWKERSLLYGTKITNIQIFPVRGNDQLIGVIE